MDTKTTEMEVGALPTLDDDILHAPTSTVKSKTNVGKFTVLAMVVAAFLFIIGGLLIYQKKHKKTVDVVAAKTEVKPSFATKNTSLDGDSLNLIKTEIKQKQTAEEALIKEVEDAQIETQKNNALEAQKNAGQAQAVAYQSQFPDAAANGGVSSVNANGQPIVRQPTAHERKMGGGVLLDNSGSRMTESANNEQRQEQKEIQTRMAALGLRPDGSPLGGSGANTSAQGSGSSASKSGSNDALSSRLQPNSLASRTAGKLPNLNYLLKKGTSIPCGLKTGIDTTLPGFVICNVLNDVYSANGKVLLIERGATVFGEQQSQLKQGQERTFVVWTRIDNPSGIFADIDSPATDQMGYSGIAGYVDTHFFQRFGGAIMLSLIKDFSQAYTQRIANSSNTVATATQPYSNTNQATQDMATETLRNSINIPPTLVVLPAKIVNVLVARDVSFENVYSIVE